MIPLATTTITVQRTEVPPDTDGYEADPPAPTEIASGIRAVVSPPGASVSLAGGDRVVTRTRITSDPVDCRSGDTVIDDSTCQCWLVDSVQQIAGLGVTHTLIQVRYVTGAT